jgi:hypothetical protein
VRPGAPISSHAGPRGATRDRVAPWFAVGAFVVIAGVIAVWTWRRLEVPGHPELPRYGMQDFRDGVYYPVRTLLAGDNPYSPSAVRRHFAPDAIFPLYTPVHLAMYLPYGLVSQRVAELVHFTLSLGMLLALALVCVRLCDIAPTVTAVFGLAAFLVATRAGYSDLFYGQVAAFLVVPTYGALHYARRMPWLAAVCLALACAKPSYGGPLALLLLAHGAVGTVVLGGTLAGLVTAVVGVFLLRAAGGLAPFVASLQENVATWSRFPELTGAQGIHPVDAVAVIDRFVELPPALHAALGAGILALGAFAAVHAWRRSELLGESMAAATVLTCIHHQIYDVLLLAVPLTAFASRRLTVVEGKLGAALRVALLALLGVAFFNYAASYQVLDGFHLTGAVRLAIVSAAGVAVTVTFLTLVWMSLARRTEPVPTDAASASAGGAPS